MLKKLYNNKKTKKNQKQYNRDIKTIINKNKRKNQKKDKI